MTGPSSPRRTRAATKAAEAANAAAQQEQDQLDYYSDGEAVDPNQQFTDNKDNEDTVAYQQQQQNLTDESAEGTIDKEASIEDVEDEEILTEDVNNKEYTVKRTTMATTQTPNNTTNNDNKQRWLTLPKEIEDNNQATSLPDFDKVTLLRFKDILSSESQYNRFRARVQMTLRSAGLINLIDKHKYDPKQTDNNTMNWFKLSKMVASWLCSNMTQEIFERCTTTSQRMLLATEVWTVLERMMVGTGVFAMVSPINKFLKITPDEYPAPSIYATSMLAEYGRICSRWNNFMPPYTVLISMLGQIDNAHITDVILQTLEEHKNIYNNYTKDDLVRDVNNMVTRLKNIEKSSRSFTSTKTESKSTTSKPKDKKDSDKGLKNKPP
ncbi:hypothetical protein N7454_008765 [Penicillium verhagenii]|nr:hypothetical protein N7454_008765 [Penicillium verhagenii]